MLATTQLNDNAVFTNLLLKISYFLIFLFSLSFFNCSKRRQPLCFCLQCCVYAIKNTPWSPYKSSAKKDKIKSWIFVMFLFHGPNPTKLKYSEQKNVCTEILPLFDSYRIDTWLVEKAMFCVSKELWREKAFLFHTIEPCRVAIEFHLLLCLSNTKILILFWSQNIFKFK